MAVCHGHLQKALFYLYCWILIASAAECWPSWVSHGHHTNVYAVVAFSRIVRDSCVMFKCHSTQVARFRLISLQPFDPLRSNQGQLWEPVRVLWMLRSGPPQGKQSFLVPCPGGVGCLDGGREASSQSRCSSHASMAALLCGHCATLWADQQAVQVS